LVLNRKWISFCGFLIQFIILLFLSSRRVLKISSRSVSTEWKFGLTKSDSYWGVREFQRSDAEHNYEKIISMNAEAEL
jgi:hypothetical protein